MGIAPYRLPVMHTVFRCFICKLFTGTSDETVLFADDENWLLLRKRQTVGCRWFPGWKHLTTQYVLREGNCVKIRLPLVVPMHSSMKLNHPPGIMVVINVSSLCRNKLITYPYMVFFSRKRKTREVTLLRFSLWYCLQKASTFLTDHTRLIFSEIVKCLKSGSSPYHLNRPSFDRLSGHITFFQM